MGSLENRLRAKWQNYSGKKAEKAEKLFYEVFESLFKDTDLEIEKQPHKFRDLYLNVNLDAKELTEIYVPAESITRHGIRPDALIRNKLTGKEIYIEIKRQDGWVENKKRKDGRGNAHERLCKYFSPGLTRHLKAESHLTNDYPFWFIFEGDITRDICHVKEIRFWFDGHDENFTFWRDTSNPTPVIEHFLKYILPLLDNE